MKVRRIVADVEVQDPSEAKRFYQDIFGLEVLLGMGWIATYGSSQKMSIQISFQSEGGAGAPIPDLSIEVDDLDATSEGARRKTRPRLRSPKAHR